MAPTHASFFNSPIECLPSATLSASAKNICLEEEETLEPEVSAKSMSNLTSASGEASFSSESRSGDHLVITMQQHQSFSLRNASVAGTSTQESGDNRKRNPPGHPDPEAEVIALSPRTLMTTNRFVCDICGKGFQRDQNLQLHRRGHNLPWKLRQRACTEVKKRVYVCPEQSCIHHDSSRALGDLTGIKKHFCRKHGEKKWKCDKCSKKYAVQSDWKAHCKTCGSREYRCHCGTLFSRKDSFITHRAFCDALAEETAKVSFFNVAPIQVPYTGQGNNYFGSANTTLSRAASSMNSSLAPAFRSFPKFLGMSMAPYNNPVSPPSPRADFHVSSIRHGASSADSFNLVQLYSNSPTNVVSPYSMIPTPYLSHSGIGEGQENTAGLSGIYQMLQLNRLSQSDCVMEESQNYTYSENGFQEYKRETQKENASNSGKQHPCQSSYSTNHGRSADGEKLEMGSLFSLVGSSFGRASGMESPVRGQNLTCAGRGIISNAGAPLDPSNTQQILHHARTASPIAEQYLPSPAGFVGTLASRRPHETTNVLSISTSTRPHHQTPRRLQMSATALLQKAAQMGAIFSDSSRKQYCQDLMETESTPNKLSISASKIPDCRGDDPTLSRDLNVITSVHSSLSHDKLVKLRPSEHLSAIMDGTLETDQAMSIERSSTSDSPGVKLLQQATSLSCHARTPSSFQFSEDVSHHSHNSRKENNIIRNLCRNSSGFATSTIIDQNAVAHRGDELYGSVFRSHAPLNPAGLQKDIVSNLREQLIYESPTRDFLGVDAGDRTEYGLSTADYSTGSNTRTHLSEESTGIFLDLCPSVNSLRDAETTKAWRLSALSRMGI